MPKFDVNIYTIVRVKISNVEANSPKEAAEFISHTNFYDRFKGEDQEWAEQHESYLVDEVDENGEIIDYDNSQYFLDAFQVLATQHDLGIGTEQITI